MTQPSRERLVAILAGAAGSEAFSASRTAPVGDLQLEVRGVGPIQLPVTQVQARQLCLLARPARYGRGERTLLDRGVRDTWEIPKSRVRIDTRRWNRTLLPMLERLGRDLGLRSGCNLRAELHSMLVYARGQFFVEHQDSEKDDTMVGSLVVSLPSTFKGGALEVRHGDHAATYRGSRKALSFVAFYGDCRHQVKPITSGYRVVLTYNLLLGGEPARPEVDLDPELVGDLARCLDEHFSSGADRLVYLLDHEYTRRGLDWSRLKGADARRAMLLRQAASNAGCEFVLALSDVHESWTAYDANERSYQGWGHGRYDDWDDEDDFDAEATGEYDLEDLIDSEVTLDCWLDPRNGQPVTVSLPVSGDEVCASTPSGDLEPYRSEYEGYMGNWGNTLDRWYHRGAVALWPSIRSFAAQAEASPSLALDELAARARSGDQHGAREAGATLAPFWGRAVARADAKGLFGKALRTARLFDEPDLAMMLLRPFRVEMLTPSHARAVSLLVDGYGERWAAELIASWSADRRFSSVQSMSPEVWLGSLPQLCLALREAGEAGVSGARMLLQESWGWISGQIARGLAVPSPSRRDQALSELARPVGAVLEGAATVGATELLDEVVRVLCCDDGLVGCAVAILRGTPASQWHVADLDAVASHCSGTLEARLARPGRADDDWSIELPGGCGCELCRELGAFLRDPTRTRLEWPLAKERRRHVHARIDTAELPVTHQTRRIGRPYTLVLTKTDALFKLEAQRRRRDARDLAWLERSRGNRTSRS
jgi:hypothetical protein